MTYNDRNLKDAGGSLNESEIIIALCVYYVSIFDIIHSNLDLRLIQI